MRQDKSIILAAINTVAEAIEDVLVGKGNHDASRNNASACVAQFAAIANEWDNGSVREMIRTVNPKLLETSAFTVRLSQARRVIKHYGSKIVARWKNGQTDGALSLGTLHKSLAKVSTNFEKMCKVLDRMHSDDVREVSEYCDKILAKRQSVQVASKDLDEYLALVPASE